MTSQRKWIVRKNGKSRGPYAVEDLRRFLAAGKIAPATKVRPHDAQEWTTIADLDDLAVPRVSAVRRRRRSRQRPNQPEPLIRPEDRSGFLFELGSGIVVTGLLAGFLATRNYGPGSPSQLVIGVVSAALMWLVVTTFVIHRWISRAQRWIDSSIALLILVALGTGFYVMISEVASRRPSPEEIALKQQVQADASQYLKLAAAHVPAAEKPPERANSGRDLREKLFGKMIIVERPPGTTEWRLHAQMEWLPGELVPTSPDEVGYIAYVTDMGRHRSQDRSSSFHARDYELEDDRDRFTEYWVYQVVLVDIDSGDILICGRNSFVQPGRHALTTDQLTQEQADQGAAGFSPDDEAYIYGYNSDGWIRQFFGSMFLPGWKQ